MAVANEATLRIKFVRHPECPDGEDDIAIYNFQALQGCIMESRAEAEPVYDGLSTSERGKEIFVVVPVR